MQSISLQQQQKLQARLSPEQIQVVKMLELPAMELQQRVNEELQENPALEEGKDPVEEEEKRQEEIDLYGEEEDYSNPLQNEDFNYDTYVEDDEIPDYKLRTNNNSPDDEVHETPLTGGTSFMEYLKSQVYLTKMTKPQRHIAKWVLGNIDEDGYLRRSIEQLVDDLSFQEGLVVPDEEMAAIVEQIKLFDPPGVASANLQECLIAQLKQKKETEAVTNAILILQRYFKDFSHHRFDKLSGLTGLTEEQFKAAINEIMHLNQKPINAFTGNNNEDSRNTIIPDFYVEVTEDSINVSLNSGDIPDLHVSREYKQMLSDYSKQEGRDKAMGEAVKFIRNKIDAAQWFINAIAERNETLYRTMVAIVEFQREFFLEGDETFLKPMILQDIADKTGYDTSTISRVSNSKYVQTEFGTFPLKHFFSEAMTNSEGEEVSTRELKRVLQEIISKEDKLEPLSDDVLAKMMTEQGYPIARRTIAKYREMLGIPVARLRKQV